MKKFINYTSTATLWQKNTFVAEVTFKKNFSLSATLTSYKKSEKLIELIFDKS